MTILAIAIQILAFYMLYNASKRAHMRNDAFSAWLQGRTLFSKIAGLILLITSFSLLIVAKGLGVGLFLGFLTLMTFGSLIVLFIPLKFKN